jgi:trans-aconitate methyltransferase
VAKFDASEYARFRVSYPRTLFKTLSSYCGSHGDQRPIRVLDLGAGTGLSSGAFLDFYPGSELTLVEPDPAMLAVARAAFQNDSRVSYFLGSAETFKFETQYDLVLVGSAWHWMDRTVLQKKFEDAEVGAVFIFEYQFPKAKSHQSLNEWIRREFNLKWKTLTQVPRGNLTELTDGLRSSPFMRQKSHELLPQEQAFDLDQFFGMLVSQSRFLAYESTLPDSERKSYREKLRGELTQFWDLKNEISFLLGYEGLFFERRSV